LNYLKEELSFALQALNKLALVAARHNVQLASLGEKFTWNLFSEIAYATDEKARVFQQEHAPEEVKRYQYPGMGPTRDELMEEIKSVNAKTEALVDYVSNIVNTIPGFVA
jgi:1-aminocyclopropane-1-carboxylate deaminase/D-cysteine desulfhydrase-like pyridoxal-dependent ACC family enzyme